MEPLRGEHNKSAIQDFVDTLRRREWRALRRLLLGLFFPAIALLWQNGGTLGAYKVYAWAALGLVILVLLISEIFSRPAPGAVTPTGYSATIRGLVSFGEDDAAAFATLGRRTDVSKVLNALRDPQFRFGVLFAESGCGKTSLLRAGVQPELKKLGYTVHIDDINNQEEPLRLLARLLGTGAAAGASAAGGAGASHAGSAEYFWLASSDTAPGPVFVVLDQFEQFFLHYGRGEQAEPFLSFLQQWWTLHPASQVRILVSIREDYLGKLAVIQERLEYVQTVHNHIRLRKFTPDDAVEVLRSMATESGLVFHEAAVRQACRDSLASREDGAVSPVDLQIFATGVRDLPGTTGFTAEVLQALGGLEGALERYLPAQLESLAVEREKAALAVLRLLSELKQGVLTGWLSAQEIAESLKQEYGFERVVRMIGWLSNPGVRLIIENESLEGKRYRLVHDRLVAAVRKVSGQVLEMAERAGMLLDQRVTEYLSNQRRSRFLLPLAEWRFIGRHSALVDWGGREAEKRELLVRSGRRVKAWAGSGLAFVTFLCLGWAAWEFQPKVLLWRIQRELARDIQQMSDGPMLQAVASALVTGGVNAKDPKLIERAVAPAERIESPLYKAGTLRIVALALAKAGADAKDPKLIDRAVATAERIADSSYKDGLLRDVALALFMTGGTGTDPKLIELAVATVERIADPLEKAAALSKSASALVRAHETAKALKLLDQAAALAPRIANPSNQAWLIRDAASPLFASGETAKALKLLDQAGALAQRIPDPSNQARALRETASLLFASGETANALKLIEPAVAAAERIENPTYRAAEQLAIASALFAAGETPKALKLLHEAAIVVQRIADPFARATSFRDIASSLVHAGETRNDASLINQATVFGERISNSLDRDLALRTIALALVATGEKTKDPRLIDAAMAVAERIADPSEKARSLIAIASALTVAEKARGLQIIDRAVAVAERISDPSGKASALNDMASALATAGEQAKESDLIRQAVVIAEPISDPWFKVAALRNIAPSLFTSGQRAKALKLIDQAETVAHRISEPSLKAAALRDIASSLGTAGETAKAFQLFEQAVAAVDAVADPWGKARALSNTVFDLVKVGESRKDAKFIELAVTVSEKINDQQRYSATSQVSSALASFGNLRRARRIAMDLPIHERALALARIVQSWTGRQTTTAAPAQQ